MSLRDELIEAIARKIAENEYGDPDSYESITLPDTFRTTPRWHHCVDSGEDAISITLTFLETHGLQIVRRDDFYDCAQVASANLSAFSSQNDVVNEIVKAAFGAIPNLLTEEPNDD